MEDCGSKRVGGLRTVFYPLSRQKSPTVKREKNACQLGTGCASLIHPLKISAVLHASLMPIILMQLCRNSAAFNTFPLCNDAMCNDDDDDDAGDDDDGDAGDDDCLT